MPQLIAMIIIVVGAMIYMFQTFGGTGDKIEGIAQKTSVITEINNIKNGLKLAAKSGNIGTTNKEDTSKDLFGLAKLAYFPEQINTQITVTPTGGDERKAGYNKYYAISFGAEKGEKGAESAMVISLVTPKAGFIPGIYVEFQEKGSLGANRGFLESQIANDLKDIAYIDRHAEGPTAEDGAYGDKSALEKRTPKLKAGTAGAATESDGKFIIYFKDFGADEVIITGKE